jgi:signal transduction histidine kinase
MQKEKRWKAMTPANTLKLHEMVRNRPTASPETPVRTIHDLLQRASPLDCVVAVAGQRPVGLLMRCHLDRVLSTEFGRALYINRPLADVMDKSPVIADVSATPVQVADWAMARNEVHLYDDILVVRDGAVIGTVSVQVLLSSLAKVEGVLELAGGAAHELTQPLQVILGYLELLQRTVEMPRVDDAIVAMHSSVKRMVAITKSLQGLL